MQAAASQPIVAVLAAPTGPVDGLGARVEVPLTRAIVSSFHLAVRDEDSGDYTVTLDQVDTPGEYQLVWRTSDPEPPEFEAFVPLVVAVTAAAGGSIADTDDWTPALDEVSALMLARMADGDDNTVAEFTEDSTPTAAEVGAIIDSVVEEIQTKIGGIPAFLVESARKVAAMGAVAYIEQSRHPEAAGAGDALYPSSRAIFLGRLADLDRACPRPARLT